MMQDVNAGRTRVHSRWDSFLDWLIPMRCVVCDQTHSALCAACGDTLQSPEPACLGCALPFPTTQPFTTRCNRCFHTPLALDHVHAALIYQWPVNELICRFKFHRDVACGRILADIMANTAVNWPRPEAIVPIPLHPRRLRHRGYDQALLLGRSVAKRCDIPCRTLLDRTQHTVPQSHLPARARQTNVRGVFALHAPSKVAYRHIALIDDVMTTGATVSAAARCLRQCGVARVDAWICARALHSADTVPSPLRQR